MSKISKDFGNFSWLQRVLNFVLGLSHQKCLQSNVFGRRILRTFSRYDLILHPSNIFKECLFSRGILRVLTQGMMLLLHFRQYFWNEILLPQKHQNYPSNLGYSMHNSIFIQCKWCLEIKPQENVLKHKCERYYINS